MAAAAAAVLGALALPWLLMGMRRLAGKPIIPYQPRQAVPWGGRHVLLMVVLYFALSAVAVAIVSALPAAAAPRPDKAAAANALNPIAQMLLAAHNDPWVMFAAILAAVVAAPLVEEFFFRVLLQGWLESLERRHRRMVRLLWPLLPCGFGPIVLVSLLFGVMHFRIAKVEQPVDAIVAMTLADAVAKLLAMAAIIAVLRVRHGAAAADFGWVPQRLASDVGLGLLAFLAMLPPLYLLLYGFQLLLPATIAPDPVPLFFFALVLGTLYYRTHRLAPSVVTHAALNATTLLLLWSGMVQ